MYFAAIDIGSNAIRLVIASKHNGHQFQITHKYRAALRLGEDVFLHDKITNKKITRIIKIFKAFKKVLNKYQIQSYLAVATSALREAQNRDEVICLVEEKTKIQIKLIDGLQEAQYIFTAVLNKINIVPHHVLLMDIGGGSVELTFALNGKPVATKSFLIGTVRLIELLKKKKMSEGDLPFLLIEIAPEIQNFINSNRSETHPIQYIIGTGGNLEAMGKLKTQVLRKKPGTSLSADELSKLLEIVRRVPVKQRPKKLKIKSDRADVIVPAMLITKLIMIQSGIQKLVIPYVGLKDGLLQSLN